MKESHRVGMPGPAAARRGGGQAPGRASAAERAPVGPAAGRLHRQHRAWQPPGRLPPLPRSRQARRHREAPHGRRCVRGDPGRVWALGAALRSPCASSQPRHSHPGCVLRVSALSQSQPRRHHHLAGSVFCHQQPLPGRSPRQLPGHRPLVRSPPPPPRTLARPVAPEPLRTGRDKAGTLTDLWLPASRTRSLAGGTPSCSRQGGRGGPALLPHLRPSRGPGLGPRRDAGSPLTRL